ncbi:hypothetical protein ACFQ4L_01540 [Lapidilactobacillus mulanensis]|uniref:Uncharacterized protein n=2 Tax=Lactobacillaceae TaxID=33958 RepID=A0ABW4DLT1_9LACO|nr:MULTISPECIES: hypothetical protein [Lactobacillaceae]
MSINDIAVVRREDFYDDYRNEVKPEFQRDQEELVEEMVTILVDSPESYQHIQINDEMTEDGHAKLFTFTSYESEYGLQIHYVGVNDG